MAPVRDEALSVPARSETVRKSISFDVETERGIRGVVVSARSRIPIKQGRVLVFRNRGTRNQPVMGEWLSSVYTNKFGEFQLPAMGRARYILLVKKGEFTSDVVEVEAKDAQERAVFEVPVDYVHGD